MATDIQTYIERHWRGRPGLAASWTPAHEERLRAHLEQAEQIIAQSVVSNEPPTHDELGFMQQTLGWTMAEVQEETHRVAANLGGAQ